MKLTFLGTGTSTGVPQLMCGCEVCRSTDPRDKRLRCSALIETQGKNILIDCGPDFREQMLRFQNGKDLDALLVTHHHYDHVGGTDDLRPYCKGKKAFPIYGNRQVEEDMHRRMPYSFMEHPYPGVPLFDVHVVQPFVPFEISGIEVMPLTVNHYLIDILAFRIGKLGYVTDAKYISEDTREALKGVDTLVINALRHKEHISHMTLAEALAVIEEIKPRVAYLTHISHDMELTANVEPTLPHGVFLANDGSTIEIPD